MEYSVDVRQYRGSLTVAVGTYLMYHLQAKKKENLRFSAIMTGAS